ncbi:hypothetical protein L7F22_045628 [Adiantum nelumboides]|nr:hypothetical protein [Adiantum nelumboides]MCO5591638.1 hypothetical protein [Adiantum nelumboides]
MRQNPIFDGVDNDAISDDSIGTEIISLLLLQVWFVHERTSRKSAAIGDWYVKPRSRHYWHTFFKYTQGDDVHFEANVRIPRECFAYICEVVKDDLQQRRIPPTDCRGGVESYFDCREESGDVTASSGIGWSSPSCS